VCRAHDKPGTFLPHIWVNAEPVPRFYPNAVTLEHDEAAVAEQVGTIDILATSNLPGRWAVKDSFNALDLSRRGFDVLLEASWIKSEMPAGEATSDIVWQRERQATSWPIWDPAFAMFTGRRGFQVVAGGMLYCSDGVVGLSNVVAEAADAVAVWRSLILLSARTFPRLPVVGYESGGELAAALDAGFEIGDPLRVWVRTRD
jgi:hypothetical protein